MEIGSDMEPLIEVPANQLIQETLSRLFKPLEDPLIKHCHEIVNPAKKHASKGIRLMADILWSKIFP